MALHLLLSIGNGVHPGTVRQLARHGIRCGGKTARQMTKADYDRFDLLIGMDRANLRNMQRICGGDPDGKMHLLKEFSNHRKGSPARPEALLGRGGARERSEFSQQAETEKSGLCSDDVADPWYTGDFEATWRDVEQGCRGLLAEL